MKNKMLQKSRLSLAVMAAFLVALMAITGCSKKSKISYMIPNDATIVVCADINSIWDKGELDNVNRLATIKLLRQEVKAESPEGAKIMDELIEDPNSCGLDLKDEVFVFNSKSLKSELFIGFKVKDEDRFEEFLRNASKKLDFDLDVSKEGEYRLAAIDHMYICWNSDKGYVLGGSSGKNAKNDAEYLMTLSENNSMASDEYFHSTMRTKHDLRAYIDFNNSMDILKDVNRGLYRQMEPVMPMYKDMGIFIALDFEKGSINMEGKIVGPNTDNFKESYGDFNRDLIDYLPEETFMAATIAYNMDKMIKDMEKTGNIDLDQKTNRTGPTIREILKCFSGSFAINVSSFTTDRYNDPKPVFTIVADLNNSRKIKDLMESGRIERDGDEYKISDEVSVKFNDKVIIISNDQPTLKAFSKGGTGNGIAEIASDAKEGNYAFINLDLDDYPSTVKRGMGSAAVKLISEYLESAELKTVTSDCGFELSINLKNTSKNSLAFTLDYIDDNIAQFGRIFN